jgi:hypothetical protein
MPDKTAFRVNNSLVNVGGVLYPITDSFVVRETNGILLPEKTLFPVTDKFVIGQDALEQYTGLIYEFYNTMPWGSESYGMSTHMWFRMACAYINFASITYDLGGGFIFTEEDTFGLTFQLVNAIGENTLYGGPLDGMNWDDREAYIRARRGGYGAAVSASTPYRYGSYSAGGFTPDAIQPNTYVGTECEFVSLEGSGETSGSGETWEFGWMGAIFTGNCIYPSERSRDMVMWFYDLAYDTGVWQYEMDTVGIPNDALFLPGQTGWRKISNHYKYAPWERYPHLM